MPFDRSLDNVQLAISSNVVESGPTPGDGTNRFAGERSRNGARRGGISNPHLSDGYNMLTFFLGSMSQASPRLERLSKFLLRHRRFPVQISTPTTHLHLAE